MYPTIYRTVLRRLLMGSCCSCLDVTSCAIFLGLHRPPTARLSTSLSSAGLPLQPLQGVPNHRLKIGRAQERVSSANPELRGIMFVFSCFLITSLLRALPRETGPSSSLHFQIPSAPISSRRCPQRKTKLTNRVIFQHAQRTMLTWSRKSFVVARHCLQISSA